MIRINTEISIIQIPFNYAQNTKADINSTNNAKIDKRDKVSRKIKIPNQK